MTKQENSIRLLMIIARRYKLIQIMRILIITKELVLTGKETMMKPSSSLHQLFKQNPQKLISIITEVLHTEKRNNLIMQFMIMKTQLKSILIILRLFTTELFVGINQENSKNRNKIMKMQLNFNQLIFQRFIILEPSEKRLEEISLTWLLRTLRKLLRSTQSMLHHTTEEDQSGTDSTNSKKQLKTSPWQSAQILRTQCIFTTEVAVTVTWVSWNYPSKILTWQYSLMIRIRLSILIVGLSIESWKGLKML